MTDKRFMTQYGIKIHDLQSGHEYLVNEVDAQEIVDLLNRLDMTVKERSKGMSTLQKKINELHEENIRLKHELLCEKLGKIPYKPEITGKCIYKPLKEYKE